MAAYAPRTTLGHLGANPKNWPALYLPAYSTEGLAMQHQVSAWAWARANGRSLRQLCKDRDWSRSTFYWRVNRALTLIAEGLERDARRNAA